MYKLEAVQYNNSITIKKKNFNELCLFLKKNEGQKYIMEEPKFAKIFKSKIIRVYKSEPDMNHLFNDYKDIFHCQMPF